MNALFVWVPLSRAGQVAVGDYISFTFSGRPVCARVSEVIAPGTDLEEVVYNRSRNHYFITSMALDGTGNHKSVSVFTAWVPA